MAPVEDICPLTLEQIETSVVALQKVLEEKSQSDLTLTHPRINLVVSTHRIPSKKEKTVFIKLPHPVFTTKSEVCIFTKDVDKKDLEVTEEAFKEQIKNALDFSPKIIPLVSLRKDYKSHEAKRALCDSYDLFLADDRIMKFVPARIGKHFFLKKKHPSQIKLNSNKLKEELLNALSSTRWILTGSFSQYRFKELVFNHVHLCLGRGNCSMMHAANTNFTTSEITENLQTCISTISSSMIRGWANVRTLHIKTDDSIAIPVYINDDAPEDADVKDEEEVEYIKQKQEKRKRQDFYAPKILKKRRLRKTAPRMKKSVS